MGHPTNSNDLPVKDISFIFLLRSWLMVYLQLRQGKRKTRRRVTKLFLALVGVLYAICRRHGACDWSVMRLRAQAMLLTGENYSMRQVRRMLKLLQELHIVELRQLKEGHLQWWVDLPKTEDKLDGFRIGLETLPHRRLTGEAVLLFNHMKTLTPLNRAKLRSKEGVEDWTDAGLAHALGLGLDATKEALSLLQREKFIDVTEARNQFRIIAINPDWKSLCSQKLEVMNRRRRAKVELEAKARKAGLEARDCTRIARASDHANATNVPTQREHGTPITRATNGKRTPMVDFETPLSIYKQEEGMELPSSSFLKPKTTSACERPRPGEVTPLPASGEARRSSPAIGAAPPAADEIKKAVNTILELAPAPAVEPTPKVLVAATKKQLALWEELKPRLKDHWQRTSFGRYFETMVMFWLEHDERNHLEHFAFHWLCGGQAMSNFEPYMVEIGKLKPATKTLRKTFKQRWEPVETDPEYDAVLDVVTSGRSNRPTPKGELDDLIEKKIDDLREVAED